MGYAVSRRAALALAGAALPGQVALPAAANAATRDPILAMIARNHALRAEYDAAMDAAWDLDDEAFEAATDALVRAQRGAAFGVLPQAPPRTLGISG